MARSVFGFLARKNDLSEIEGPEHMLRLPRFADFEEWHQLRRDSRAFLQPWEPLWGKDDLTEASFRHRVVRSEQEYHSGVAVPLLIFERTGKRLIGGITIGHIRRGAGQNCMIGYWMGAAHAGQGHMKKVLPLTVQHIFARLSLHRIEAACIPTNQPSIRLLAGAGFRLEGELKAYLKINGAWRDHLLFALVNPAPSDDGNQGI